MPWTDVSTAIPGTVYTAARRNTEVKENLAILRTGGLAIASQAAEDDIYASSATQFGRAVPGERQLQNWFLMVGGI